MNFLKTVKSSCFNTPQLFLAVFASLIWITEVPVFAESPAESMMEGLMEEIRGETQESVKNEAKKDTGAIVNEETLSPSGELSGLYSGLNDRVQFICQLKFSSSKVIGRCASSKVKVRFIGTKTGTNTFTFPFQIQTISPSCTFSHPGPNSGKIIGDGSPGTRIGLMVAATPCNPLKTFAIVKQ
ncbi:MAG: hypothetical protein ACQ9MH_13515 [Nitrospinales bacterium]